MSITYPFGMPSTSSMAESASFAKKLSNPSVSAQYALEALTGPPGIKGVDATENDCPPTHFNAIAPAPGLPFNPVPSSVIDRTGYILCAELPNILPTPTPTITPTPTPTPSTPVYTIILEYGYGNGGFTLSSNLNVPVNFQVGTRIQAKGYTSLGCGTTSGQNSDVSNFTLGAGLNSAINAGSGNLSTSNYYRMQDFDIDAPLGGANKLTIAINGGSPTARDSDTTWSEAGYQWRVVYSGECSPNLL